MGKRNLIKCGNVEGLGRRATEACSKTERAVAGRSKLIAAIHVGCCLPKHS